jgi:sulfoquinovosidase
VHNTYPIDWHRMSREVLEEAYPDGDWVMFTRSGFTYDQQVAQIVWTGDQAAEFNKKDGFPTVLPAGLTLGLAGVPFVTHDIGGFSGGPREKELFYRWTELGAFTGFMRTHEGLQQDENVHPWTDGETLEFFARFTRIHQALAPYLMEVAEEGVTEGLPMVRHTVLVDPDWPEAFEAHNQWMIGDDLLIAPVVTEGAQDVEVRFPAGKWEHVFSGKTYEGQSIQTVDAPVGMPAAFARQGTMDSEIEKIRSVSAE